jgi:hypothetical protein
MGHSGQRRIRLHRWGRHGREGRLVPIKLCADPNRGIYASKRWKMLRRQVLFEQPLCACGCGHIAQDVDHILPIEHGGDPWDRTNLQALTHQCHARKTRSEQA